MAPRGAPPGTSRNAPKTPPVASAIAIADGRILAAGSEAECWSAVGSDAHVFDMGGRVIVPGFIDAHLHWAGYALTRLQLRLEASQDLPAVLRAVKASCVKDSAPDEWIVGRGWDHANWGRWPSATDLDTIAPGRLIALTRKDGHAMWVSTRVMELAEIDSETPSPEGGLIERKDGAPTGILKENAIGIVRRLMPAASDQTLGKAMVSAWPDAWRHGITGVHDMGFGTRSLPTRNWVNYAERASSGFDSRGMLPKKRSIM